MDEEIQIPKVSIITPTYNLIENDLTDEFNLLVTLLNLQTYPDVEHIVINKASNDETEMLLMDYKSKGYLQFYSEPDSGKYDALNKGIMRAKGKYVAFLSCDDFMHDITALMEIIQLMEENDADYSYAPAYTIHPEGYVFNFEPAMFNTFQVVPCQRQAMVFKKSVLAAEGYFDDKFKIMADFDLMMRLMMKGYVGVYYEKNYVTCRMSEKAIDFAERTEAECRSVYIKNFRSLYPLTNEIVDKIVKYSEFPKPLLDKLSEFYPEEYKDYFYEACEEMHQLRLNALNPQAQEEQIEEEVEDVQEEVQEEQAPPTPQTQTQAPNPGLPRSPGLPGMSGQSSMRPQMPGQSSIPPIRHTTPPGFNH